MKSDIVNAAFDRKYRFSKNIGLGFKYTSSAMLERLDVDKQNQDRHKFNRFEEFLTVKEGEVMVSIEHWYETISQITAI